MRLSVKNVSKMTHFCWVGRKTPLWALQQQLNGCRCRLVGDVGGPKGPCIRWGCISPDPKDKGHCRGCRVHWKAVRVAAVVYRARTAITALVRLLQLTALLLTGRCRINFSVMKNQRPPQCGLVSKFFDRFFDCCHVHSRCEIILWCVFLLEVIRSTPNKLVSNIRPSVHKTFHRFQWNLVCR